MQHRQSRPPLSARLAAVGSLARLRTAAGFRRRSGRLGLALLVLALVTGFVLTAPVVSGSGTGTEQAGDALVVMGIDGRPSSAAFADASARLSMGPDGVQVEEPASRSERTPLAAAAPVAPPAAETAPPAAPSAAPSATTPVPVEAPPAAVEEPVTPAPAPAPAPAAAPAPKATQQAAPAPPAPAPAGSDRATQVLALVNQERAAAGCRPLSADGGLAAVAAAHSADMRDRGYFDHTNLAGQSPFDRASAAGVSARAENIARGQSDPAAVMTAWMNSPGHRANILDCSLSRLGVGIADGGGGPWWTQLFG
ncbi:Uncharacterized conserved protein YkwD, contains CAP (CSP/antigen 5/PR1) domain [Blastococcus fimeti]|nr:Uncharacterized conserved protein YkwD, contains CAP (CSP/antigen 5/PR1) domain [Blastococcus fimeti]